MRYFTLIFLLSRIVMAAPIENEIKTYMQFDPQVDPAKIATLTDLEISYSLASTLVELDEIKQPKSGLAKTWKPISEKTLRFTLNDAKWSDGKPLLASEVVKSFERAKALYPEALRSLFYQTEKIEAIDAKTVDFILKVPIANSNIVMKLTEPMYGVLKVVANNQLDLKVTTGPYILTKSTKSEIEMAANQRWLQYNAKMPKKITIRESLKDTDDKDVLLKTKWANVMTMSSLLKDNVQQSYKKGSFSILSRNYDRVFFFRLGKRLQNDDGTKVIRYLKNHLNANHVVQNFSGYAIANQMYPQGYILYDDKFKCEASAVKDTPMALSKPLDVLYSPSRVSPELLQNIKTVLTTATGKEPHFISVALNELGKEFSKNTHDLYIGSLSITDPNIDGAMSFMFEQKDPLIHSGTGPMNFIERLKHIRQNKDEVSQNEEFKKIMFDATCGGFILPIFHYSTLVVSREGIDLSKIPVTDEAISFSRIRFQ